MRSPVISAVTFDAGNTLLYCDPSPAEIYARELTRLGRPVHADEVGPVFKNAWSEMQRRTLTGHDRYSSVIGGERAWWADFVTEVLERLNHDAPHEELLDRLYSAFAASEVWRVYPETHSTLEALSDRSITLAVVSNWDSRLPDILDSLGLNRYFREITVSATEGVEKPCSEIFQRTLDRLGVAPSATIHVGDSPREDYLGAGAAGLRPVLIDRAGVFSTEPYHRIARLDEVVSLVE